MWFIYHITLRVILAIAMVFRLSFIRTLTPIAQLELTSA